MERYSCASATAMPLRVIRRRRHLTNLGNADQAGISRAPSLATSALALSDGKEPLFHQTRDFAAEAGQHGEAVAAFSGAIGPDPAARWCNDAPALSLSRQLPPAWPDYEVRRFTGQLPPKTAR